MNETLHLIAVLVIVSFIVVVPGVKVIGDMVKNSGDAKVVKEAEEIAAAISEMSGAGSQRVLHVNVPSGRKIKMSGNRIIAILKSSNRSFEVNTTFAGDYEIGEGTYSIKIEWTQGGVEVAII